MSAKRLLIFAVVLLACACRTARLDREPPYRIVAYVRGRADIPKIGAEKLTHVNYAFSVISSEGEAILRNPDAPAHLRALVALKAKNPRLKVLVSIGGWGADNFSDAALTEESREKFSVSVMRLIEEHHLDGVDLDWEYPGQPGPGIGFRPEDKQNFTLMLKSLREHLDRTSDAVGLRGPDRLALTIASSAGRYFQHTEMDRLHVYLDFINVMTYDFFGSFSRTTGHHTALGSRSREPKASPSAEDFVRQHLAAGIPPNKIVVGAAFYGKGWTGVTESEDGFDQPFEGWTISVPWSSIERTFIGQQGFVRHWDRKARAPYLWSRELRTFVTYDDPESLRHKARYVKRHHLGGIMYWEYSHDPREVLLTTLWEELRGRAGVPPATGGHPARR